MNDEGVRVGTIEITLSLTEDGDLIHNVETEDGMSEELPLYTALGMLEMAKDSLLHPNEDEED